MSKYLVVTGTGTDIGKTIACAAVVALAAGAGLKVAVCKPIQTGLESGDKGDAHLVAELGGASECHEIVRLAEPLAPETAARRAGLVQSTLSDLTGPIRELATRADLVIIEGAGGPLVRLGESLTILDIAVALDAPVLVVTQPGLGTLSHTELVVRAVESVRLHCVGLVIGSLPEHLDLASACNMDDLPRLTGSPVLGALPEHAGSLPPTEFQRLAPGWFTPRTLHNLMEPS